MIRNSYFLKIIVRILVLLVIVFFTSAPSSLAQSSTSDGFGSQNQDLPETPAVDGFGFQTQDLPETPALMGAPPISGMGISVKQAMEFRPYVITTPYNHNYGWIYNTGATYAAFEAWLTVPHGFKLNQLVIYFYDNDPVNNLTANLMFLPNNGGGVTFLLPGPISSEGSPPGYAYIVSSIPDYTVDLTSGTLTAEIMLPPSPSGNVRVGMVRVDYGGVVILPTILR